jgi:hypothetical protein
MAHVEITGISELEKMNRELMNENNYLIPVEMIINECAKLIAQYVPERTGDLINSIQVIKDNDNYIILVAVPYAQYMEYGTVYFPVGTVEVPRARTSTSGKPCFHPFIRPAIWQSMNEFPIELKKSLFKRLD